MSSSPMSSGVMFLARLNLPGLGVIAGLVLAWEAAVRSRLLDFEYLPAPSAVAGGLAELVRQGLLGPDILHTVTSVLVSWSIAMAIGIAAGLLLGLSPVTRRFSLASIEVLRPVPGIALAPVGILLFGFSLQTEMMVTILPALWPVLVNTMGGVTSVHARLYDVGQTFRLSRSDMVWRVLLPAALPAIVVGARLSLGLALVLAVVAEMVGNPAGLGYGIVREQQALRPDLMFAYIIVVGLLGMTLNSGLLWVTSTVFPAASRTREAL